MLLQLIFVLCSLGASSITDTFDKNGLQYEKIGKARLIDGREKCKSRRFSMLPYVNALTMSEGATDTDFLILKTHLQQMFDDVCRSFNLTGEVAPPPNEASILNAGPSGFMERFRMRWDVQKFGNDLRAFLLYNQISSPFYGLIGKEWFDEDSDIGDFVDTAVMFPQRCESASMAVVATVCTDIESAQEGDLYAIVHAGQLMEKSKVFVLYDVPEYVLVTGDSAVPVEFESCEALNGSSFVCLERGGCKCDVSTMESCEIYAENAATDFTFIRRYGTGTLVATNLPEVKIGNITVAAVSPVFKYRLSYNIEKDEDGRPQLRYSTETTPVITQASFPELSHNAEESVHKATEAIRLYRVHRKGIAMLSDRPGKASMWEDVRDFFLHLM
ncbi:hypothetical protein Y032_0228g2857 [Ancylostoma ceylanicum]|uniref:Uncharacterized protein n=1 Tax=Ancylostoma ceylanicum TaxID=53326 RepID=A0A016SG74_9BILA|nr:hypothetical protein Y032_0228g2857 [Ancylostoma ceylanicum]